MESCPRPRLLSALQLWFHGHLPPAEVAVKEIEGTSTLGQPFPHQCWRQGDVPLLLQDPYLNREILGFNCPKWPSYAPRH